MERWVKVNLGLSLMFSYGGKKNLRLVKNNIIKTIKNSVPKDSSMVPSVISCCAFVSLK